MSGVAIFDNAAAERLVKVLRLTSSDILGERAAAAQTANKLVVGFGLDWADIIRPLSKPDATRSHNHRPAWQDDVAMADRHWMDLTTWERGFATSMRSRHTATPRQRGALAEIVARLRARGRT